MDIYLNVTVSIVKHYKQRDEFNTIVIRLFLLCAGLVQSVGDDVTPDSVEGITLLTCQYGKPHKRTVRRQNEVCVTFIKTIFFCLSVLHKMGWYTLTISTYKSQHINIFYRCQ